MQPAVIAVAVFGCSQSSNGDGGDQTSESQTEATKRETTTQSTTKATTQEAKTTTGRKTTTAEENAEQQEQDGQNQGGQVEITMQGGPGQQNQQQEQQQQGVQQTITVRITGTEGLSFSGRVGNTQKLRRVEGSVPEKYEIPFGGAVVTASVRKQEPGGGTLGVEVIRDGKVVAGQESSAKTRVVNVIWTPKGQGN